jgi:hypothetical protein
MIRSFATLFIALWIFSTANAQGISTFERIAVPAGPGAREPTLFAAQDGRLIMSWTEETVDGYAVMVSFRKNHNWSSPSTVIASPDLFVNWADFPSVASFADGTLVAHWLQRSGHSAYSYEVNLAFSRDDGDSWGPPIVPHLDGTSSQHGFVTLVALDNEVIAVWLDGRAEDGDLLEAGAVSGAMQLRSAVLSSDGIASPDVSLDFMTCSCCQTAATLAGDALLVAYRDRTKDEIRDISIVRMINGAWSGPSSVHDDNWELSGCPVNGPSIAARDDRVVVAWFTGSGDVPAVNIAFSSDAGLSFGDAVQIDHGQPVGRVDTLMLEDGSVLISWVEWVGSDEAILVCRANAEGCISSQQVATNSAGNSVNFPQMAATPDGIYLAWTQPLLDGSDTIHLLRSVR